MEIETVSPGAPDATQTQETPKAETSSVATGNDGQNGAERANEQRRNEQAAAVERHKIKFGKNERELSIEELKMMAQKGWASDQRFQEAAKLQKQVKEFYEKADFDKLIEKKTGKSPVEFYKERLMAEIKKAKMTDDERAVEQKKAELQALKDEEAKIQETKVERQRAEQQAHYEQAWDKELSEAIEKEGLPKTKYAVQRAIQIGKKVVDLGLEPDWVAITREAKAQIQEDMKGLIAAYKEDPALLAMLGDELGGRISKAYANRKAPQPTMQRKATDAVKDNFRQKPAQAVDMDTWLENRRKKFENS